jgi:hypothetical protein
MDGKLLRVRVGGRGDTALDLMEDERLQGIRVILHEAAKDSPVAVANCCGCSLHDCAGQNYFTGHCPFQVQHYRFESGSSFTNTPTGDEA